MGNKRNEIEFFVVAPSDTRQSFGFKKVRERWELGLCSDLRGVVISFFSLQCQTKILPMYEILLVFLVPHKADVELDYPMKRKYNWTYFKAITFVTVAFLPASD